MALQYMSAFAGSVHGHCHLASPALFAGRLLKTSYLWDFNGVWAYTNQTPGSVH